MSRHFDMYRHSNPTHRHLMANSVHRWGMRLTGALLDKSQPSTCESDEVRSQECGFCGLSGHNGCSVCPLKKRSYDEAGCSNFLQYINARRAGSQHAMILHAAIILQDVLAEVRHQYPLPTWHNPVDPTQKGSVDPSLEEHQKLLASSVRRWTVLTEALLRTRRQIWDGLSDYLDEAAGPKFGDHCGYCLLHESCAVCPLRVRGRHGTRWACSQYDAFINGEECGDVRTARAAAIQILTDITNHIVRTYAHQEV